MVGGALRLPLKFLNKSCKEFQREQARHIYEYSFSEHTLRVTDIASGYGGCNAIIVSASEDRTCKVWSLSKGKLLRSIVFPSIIDAIALDPVRRHGSSLPPPLEKYTNSTDEIVEVKAYLSTQPTSNEPLHASYINDDCFNSCDEIRELYRKKGDK
ncbi:Protein ROOT INITIATION DEFECTIVE 3 [Camellia lanceoleosa]|uniref:Protein ROOT INITIATION DEFECTIVE 3 n=1 Tax=Camellia lanceoleosa TaxID=1840588 RepID=A0ACC0J3A6_9ERIC|nr:Protein ROOT INITIATION DEFECTIVE 3 [Camellia lanceoleosa]